MRVTGPPYKPLDAQVIPRFAGIRTYMRAPHVTELAGVDAAVYGIPFDTATSYRTGPTPPVPPCARPQHRRRAVDRRLRRPAGLARRHRAHVCAGRRGPGTD